MKQKIILSKNESNAENLEWNFPVCKWVSKENQIDWLVSRIHAKCGHKDFILDISNTWCEIFHTKNRLH